MKLCTICKIARPLSEFNKHSKRKDGLQSHCRECNRDRSRKYYHDNREKHLKVIAANKRRYTERNKKFVESIKAKGGCATCDESDICCLDFHHMDGNKDFNIATGVGGSKTSLDTFREEIRKCCCVCANCHRKIHAGKTVVTEEMRCRV